MEKARFIVRKRQKERKKGSEPDKNLKKSEKNFKKGVDNVGWDVVY